MPRPPDDLSVIKLDSPPARDIFHHFPWWSTVHVLVVVDTNIAVADTKDSFGVGRFIRLLRETKIGCTRFSVDVASRDTSGFSDTGSGGDGHVRYPGFRFNSQVGAELVVDRYHEIFVFGFKPGNDGQPDDSNIDDPNQPGVIPMAGAEQSAISGWMDAGGGVFATGDHHYLGATMGHRIPRIRSMRKWTNADGVPPIGGPTRLDTNQPFTPAQAAGTAEIPKVVERDTKPQPIEWVPVSSYQVGLFRYKRPHEVLCHPTLGPIDVMPDHPHEGLCVEPAAIEADPARRAEFPGSELPRIIAYGNVVPDPPFMHQKGDVNPRHFPMISVYDGWDVDVGRIVVDSTWHHWFNLNIDDIETAGGDNWDKIARYFVNVAKWIAPVGAYKAKCWWEVLWTHFGAAGIEDYHVRFDTVQLGQALREHLAGIHGPCTVREFVLGSICEIAPFLCEGLKERFELPKTSPCLTCPPIELVELVVLGGIVEGTRPLAEKVRAAIERGESIELHADEVARAAHEGAARALAAFSEEVTASAQSVLELFGNTTRALAS